VGAIGWSHRIVLERTLPTIHRSDLDAPNTVGLLAAPVATISAQRRYWSTRNWSRSARALRRPRRSSPTNPGCAAARQGTARVSVLVRRSTVMFDGPLLLCGRPGLTELVIGEASPPVCFKPVDVFPPALRSTSASRRRRHQLDWEPNVEPDVGGYRVFAASVRCHTASR